MSSLLFNLITAHIIYSLIENPNLSKITKGSLHIAAFADDIKIHTPTKKSADEATKLLIQLAEEIGCQHKKMRHLQQTTCRRRRNRRA